MITGPDWTLFLDRDGVINKELPNDYVKSWKEFEFEPGAIEAIAILSLIFPRIYIVTNQRGIGIGVMAESDLADIHSRMQEMIIAKGGRIDDIFYCPDANRDSEMRKPNPGMAFKARERHPSLSDMEFGRNTGMKTVFIDDKGQYSGIKSPLMDYIFKSLWQFAVDLRDNTQKIV
jgi:histidinol-phosphate phosphatase family protein